LTGDPPIAGPDPPLTKVRLSVGRERVVAKPPPTWERVAPLSAPPALVILQTVGPPVLKRPKEVRLSAVRPVADIEMGTVGWAFRKAATVVVTLGLKLAPVGPGRKANDIVTVAMVFPLSDMFECEESDSLPPDYYIPRKKIQPCFLGLFPELLQMVKFLSILG
jgi:hypothetical protein